MLKFIATAILALSATAPAFAAGASACNAGDAPARISSTYYEIPSIAAEQGVTGTSVVKLDLAADGHVTAQSLYRSSGNVWLDASALRSARLSGFLPETRKCRPVSGTYLYSVEF
jgi:TonB family protein